MTAALDGRMGLMRADAAPAAVSRPKAAPRYPDQGYATAKRVLDIAGALAGLAVGGPIILAAAAWIYLVDGGPVFYRQWRVGQHGWLFRIYKLRTMRNDAERDGVRQATRSDSRVLPGCTWMRRSHVDELPQLWNILVGDMSLVGPRPERPEIIEWLRQFVPRIDLRTAAKPGLTGLAQVRNGYTNDIAGARRKIALDLRYLRRRGILTDIGLVLATVTRLWDRSAL